MVPDSFNRLELDIYGLTEEQFDALLDIIVKIVATLGGEAGGGSLILEESDGEASQG